MRQFMYRVVLASALAWNTVGMADSPAPHVSKEAAPTGAPKEVEFDQEKIKRLSEAFGNFIGRNLKTPGIQFDMESIIRGMHAGAAGKPAPMSDQEYEEAMMQLQTVVLKQMSEDNLQAAEKFLRDNSKEEGIVEVEPGKLQYLVLEKGQGQTVTEHASPKVEYQGKYLDGTVFGSSKETGGPITIPLDQTIPGFSKGLLGMKEGEKRRIFVHPDLGYGMSGHLPPNSLLIFDVDLIQADAGKEDKNISSNSANATGIKSQSDFDDEDDEDSDDEDDEDSDEDDEDGDDGDENGQGSHSGGEEGKTGHGSNPSTSKQSGKPTARVGASPHFIR